MPHDTQGPPALQEYAWQPHQMDFTWVVPGSLSSPQLFLTVHYHHFHNYHSYCPSASEQWGSWVCETMLNITTNIFFLHYLILYLLLFHFLSHSYWCSSSTMVITNFRSVRERNLHVQSHTLLLFPHIGRKYIYIYIYIPITNSWLQFVFSFTAKIIAELEELYLCFEEKKQALEMMLCAHAGKFALLQGLFFSSQERDMGARIVRFQENILI